MKMKKTISFKGWVILIMAILVVILSITSIILLQRSAQKQVLIPEKAPESIEQQATQGAPLDNDAEQLETPKGGGAVSIAFAKEVSVNLERKEVGLFFQNPSKSTQDIVLQIIVDSDEQEVVIAQSEKIPVGYEIDSLQLLDNVKMSQGLYQGKLGLSFYDPKDGKLAIVNTAIPVEITVY